jgi:hypothetical protein
MTDEPILPPDPEEDDGEDDAPIEPVPGDEDESGEGDDEDGPKSGAIPADAF